MNSVLQNLWQHTLPRLGLDAKRKHATRAALHRLGVLDSAEVRVLAQIREAAARAKPLLDALHPPSGAPVLVWTMRGGQWVNVVEGVLATGLRARGADARVVLCDGILPACENRYVGLYPGGVFDERSDATICDRCQFDTSSIFGAFGLATTPLGRWLSEDDVRAAHARVEGMRPDEMLSLEDDGLPLGDVVRSSVVRYYRAVTWPDDEASRALLRRTAAAAILLARASRRAIDETRPSAILTSHGIYLLWGVVTEVARQRGVRVVVWGSSYRSDAIILSHGASYFEEMEAEPESSWGSFAWDTEKRARLEAYLANRWDGRRDVVRLFEGAAGDTEAAMKELRLDPARPTFAAFPNVPWDAQVHHRNVAFRDIFHWLEETVAFFASRPDWQLVVRAHPLEGQLDTRQRVDRVFGPERTLPSNVRVVPADAPLNSYALARGLRAPLIYGSQFGLELACRGMPVVLAGGAPYRGKGFTIDVTSPEQYREALASGDKLAPLAPSVRERALRYAYHYYFRRPMPFPFAPRTAAYGMERFGMTDLADLAPGRSPEMDALARGLIERAPFVWDGA